MKRKMLSLLAPLLGVWMDFWILFPMTFSLYLWGLRSIPLFSFGGLLAGAYLLGALIRRLLIRRNRMVTLAATLLVGLLIGFLPGSPLAESGAEPSILFSLLAVAAAWRGVFVAEQPVILSFPKTYTFVSLFIYFLSYYLYGKFVAVREFQRHIFIAGLIAVPTTFLLANSDMLMRASRDELKESSSMPTVRKNNRIIIILTLLTGTLIAGFQTIKDTLLNAIQVAVLFIIAWIQRLLTGKESPNTGVEALPGEGFPELPVGDSKPPSPFWEAVAEVVGTIVLIAVLLLGTVFLVKQLIKLWRYLVKYFRKLMKDGRWAGDSDGYHDEKESLIDWQTFKQNYASSIRDWLDRIRSTEPKWSQLTDNREKVRFLYRYLIMQAIASGYRFRSYLTPNETIKALVEQDRLKQNQKPTVEDLYGRARYGNGVIQDSEVEMLKDYIQNHK